MYYSKWVLDPWWLGKKAKPQVLKIWKYMTEPKRDLKGRNTRWNDSKKINWKSGKLLEWALMSGATPVNHLSAHRVWKCIQHFHTPSHAVLHFFQGHTCLLTFSIYCYVEMVESEEGLSSVGAFSEPLVQLFRCDSENMVGPQHWEMTRRRLHSLNITKYASYLLTSLQSTN